MARTTKAAPAPAKKAAKAPTPKAAPAKKVAVAKKAAPPVKKAAPAKAAAPVKKAAVATKAPAKKAASADKQVAAATKAPARKAVPAKKAPVVKVEPKKAKPSFNAKFLAQQEKALHEERATYTKQFESLRAEAASLVDDFESGDVQFDEESGEGDTINIERERDLALSEGARHQIGEIDHALGKFALGTYGICEISGDKIPEERLEAIPWARERVEYKTGGFTRR